MMNTDTVSTVTCMVTGIGPLTMGIVGTEAGVRTGGGRKAVATGQIMTEEGYHLIIEVMSVTGNLSCSLPADRQLSLLSLLFICTTIFPLALVFPLAWEAASTWV